MQQKPRIQPIITTTVVRQETVKIGREDLIDAIRHRFGGLYGDVNVPDEAEVFVLSPYADREGERIDIDDVDPIIIAWSKTETKPNLSP